MNIGILIASICSLISTGSAKVELPVAGDYVEARTASVFAGACHYNGELVTTGCDAVMAWQFNSGAWKGTDLTGVRVMAVVSSAANLSDMSAARKSEMVVDSAASDAQAKAVVDAIVARDGKSLGEVTVVRRGAVSFRHEGREYAVDARGFGAISVQGMPNDECCKQPNLVWYEPLVKLVGRKVGYTVNAAYMAGTIGERWQRGDENSAFYGAFVY